MKNLSNTFWLLFLLLFGCQNTSQVGENAPSGNAVDYSFLTNNGAVQATMDSLVKNELLPFLYTRIENREGEVLFEQSSINEQLYPGLKVLGDSWFRLWSMSKIVTISLVMDLQEDGLLNIEEPVSKYIPEFAQQQVALAADGTPITEVPFDQRETICPVQYVPAATEMTIADLIHHKAGFSYPWTGIACLDSIWAHYDLFVAKNSQDLINRLKEMPLVQQPGTEYYYGFNTTVLGLVAERAMNTSLTELVKERITGPLSIEGLQYGEPTTTDLLPRSIGKNGLEALRPEKESEVNGASLPKYAPDDPLYLGGEGMVGTTDGYADFMRMLLHKGTLNGHRLLEEATIEEMSAPHTQTDSPWGHNGYNLWVTGDTLEIMGIGEAGFWVSGGYEGTYCWIDRKREFVGLVMTQHFHMKTAPSEIIRGAVYQEIWKAEQK